MPRLLFFCRRGEASVVKYLGPFLVGTIVTVGGFLGVAATVPAPTADMRTAEQRAADAVMLAPLPISAAPRKPEPAAPDRTVTPVAWPDSVRDSGPEATASLGSVPRPQTATADTLQIENASDVAAAPDGQPAPPEPAVPLPKPALRDTAEAVLAASATPEDATASDSDDIAALIEGAEPLEPSDTVDDPIETRLAAAGDLWDQAPATSLSELVTMTEDRSGGSPVDEARAEEAPVQAAVGAVAPAPERPAEPEAPRVEVAAVPEAAVASPEPEAAAPSASAQPTRPEPEVEAAVPEPSAPVDFAARSETQPGGQPAEGKTDGPAFGAASLPSAGSLGKSTAAAASSSAPASGMVLTNVVVLDGGGFRAVRDRQGLIVRIAGIEPLSFDRVCEDGSGTSWRCGAKARAALAQQLAGRMVDCEEVAVVKPKPVREVQARCALDGTDLATWLVSEGWAVPSASDGALADAARTAEANRRGRFGVGG